MFINWRKPLIFFYFKIKGSTVPKKLRYLNYIEYKSKEELKTVQNQNLTKLLLHAWKNTEYYRDILSEHGVVIDGKVNLERFNEIPFLTKDIIRNEAKRLKAKALPNDRKPYKNFTGGSTGEPLVFWQDSVYDEMNTVNKLYFFKMVGKEIGENEIKIWGSERDLFEGTIGLSMKLQNFIYNRMFQNCFHLEEQGITSIINNINKFKPKAIWSYVDGVFTIAEYANMHGLKLHSPTVIIAGASTVFPHMVKIIEKAFNSPVVNYYGSREMGAVACQCKEKTGLHIADHSHLLETIDRTGNPIFEKEGELVITSLTNYAMPFIRYRIGDYGKLTSKKCPCGRSFSLLESVSGRVVERFINIKGDVISPIYFIHLMGVVYNPGFIKKFQVIQNDFSHITVKMVFQKGKSQEEIKPFLHEISEKIQLVMGKKCLVSYEFVDDIYPTKSGKYLYTICNLREKSSFKNRENHFTGTKTQRLKLKY